MNFYIRCPFKWTFRIIGLKVEKAFLIGLFSRLFFKEIIYKKQIKLEIINLKKLEKSEKA
jgi:hypothetical protein